MAGNHRASWRRLLLAAMLAVPGQRAAGQQPRPRLTLRAHEGAVTALAVSPDGRTLASGSFFDGTFRLWEVASGKERALMRGIPGDGGGFVALAFSPDGRTLALGREGGTVWIWDATGRRRPLLQLDVSVVRTLAFSADGQMLAVGGLGLGRTQGGELRLWRANPWREYLALRGLAAPVHCLAFAPDGRMLAGGGAGRVRLWETATGKVRKSLPAHARWGYAVAFLAQGRVLASATADEKIRLWDVRTGKEKPQPQGPLQQRLRPGAGEGRQAPGLRRG